MAGYQTMTFNSAVARAWPAPAKLNLFLHITGYRPDGYHLLQTVFQLLDFGDSLQFKPRDDGHILRVTGLQSVDQVQDLTVRAARLLQQACNTRYGVDIHMTKRLPIGGGLGGGSSDAATTLVVLNRLWGCNLSPDRLAALGVKLGADIPVFIHGHSAWAEGIGESVQTLALPKRWYVVIKPPVEVSTAALFAAPELTRNCPPITIGAFLAGNGTNVFESVVRERYPVVAEALDWLNACVGKDDEVAKLTGTGSCIFTSFDHREAAYNVLAELPRGWQGFVAKGVNRSPLMLALKSEFGSV
jgi:4-diphosphocytidyl-2-C-methyl-D-erythritol kinase